jgi:glycosyltransferase involved in cell wall biosynthesis
VVCIPAYDEERTIAKVIIDAQRYSSKVIVCDDGSADMTATIAERLGARVIRHQSNVGKGEALRSLFLASREEGADIMVTIDGDGQHDPNEIPSLVSLIADGKADIVIGARLDGTNKIPTHRRFGNKVLNIVTAQGVTDTQSGFRAYSRRAFNEILPGEKGMGVDSEILMDASQKGMKITEIRASVRYGIGKTSTHNAVFHTLDVLLSVLKLVSIRHPLLFYGIPGIVLILVGSYFGLRAYVAFSEQQILNNVTMTYELTGFLLTLAGLLAIFTAIILFTLSTVVRKGNN